MYICIYPYIYVWQFLICRSVCGQKCKGQPDYTTPVWSSYRAAYGAQYVCRSIWCIWSSICSSIWSSIGASYGRPYGLLRCSRLGVWAKGGIQTRPQLVNTYVCTYTYICICVSVYALHRHVCIYIYMHLKNIHLEMSASQQWLPFWRLKSGASVGRGS